MQRKDFHYELPEKLIASRPCGERTGSRLLTVNPATGRVQDRLFLDLPEALNPGDVLVFNDTRVIPARLYGLKETGGKVEILVERMIGEKQALAQVRSSKPPRPGSRLILDAGIEFHVLGREGDLFLLELECGRDLPSLLETHGHMPLPPYIKREDEPMDRDRYQTVYARVPGAVAAPTAGLHFDESVIGRLQARGVESAFITLHIGAGTFQPVRADHLDDHTMHREYLEVTPAACEKIKQARSRGGRVVAVGTTVVRSLETAAASGELVPTRGETDIFIRPGYRFNCVDAMLTNFHLPESTLLMLVCAFAGYDTMMAAYRHAIDRHYRFYSYGDAMFIENSTTA